MALISFVLVTISSLLGVGFYANISGTKFEDSYAGGKLREFGGYEYGLLVYENAAYVSNRTAQWAVNNLPGYLNSTEEYLKPFVNLGRDLSIVGYNLSKKALTNVFIAAEDNYPVVEAWYQKNLPVVRDSIYSAANSAKDGAILAVDGAKKYGSYAADYLQTQVFVGQLSPENLKKMTMDAYNTTQVFATNTWSWLYEKVQTVSK